MRKLHAHRRREAKAHGAEPARVDPAPRLVEFVELRRPHLVLADVGSDKGVALGDPVELLDHELRLDERARALVLEAVAAAPQLDLRPPALERGLVRFSPGRLQLLDEFLQHFAHVADDRYVDLHPLRDRRGVDVDMDDGALLLKEMFGIADHAVIEARADREQHVAVLHRHVGFIGSVHAEHAHELRVGRGITAESHQRVGARETQHAHQLGELLGSIAQNHAAAAVDHRPLGRHQHLDDLPDLPRMSLDDRVVGAHGNLVGVAEFRFVGRDVLRNVDHHGSGATGRGNIEGLLDGGRDVLDVLHQESVFDARARDADGIAFLERVLADGMSGHLAGEDHQRNRVHIRGGNTGHGAGHARTRSHQGNADLVGGACVAVCGVLDLVLLEQLVVDEQYSATGIAEHMFDALFLQPPHHNLCAAQFHIDSTGLREKNRLLMSLKSPITFLYLRGNTMQAAFIEPFSIKTVPFLWR